MGDPARSGAERGSCRRWRTSCAHRATTVDSTPRGWEDRTHWQTSDRVVIKRINRFIDVARQKPFTGIGKPEPLRHALVGAWSRRMTEEHRLVYLVDGDDLVILQARFHGEENQVRPPAARKPAGIGLGVLQAGPALSGDQARFAGRDRGVLGGVLACG